MLRPLPNKIFPYDYGTFLVPSSRGGHQVVDLIENTCSCEGWTEENPHCKHLEEMQAILFQVKMRTVIAANPFLLANLK